MILKYLNVCANKNPVKAPVKSEGAIIPPFPPAPIVKEDAITLVSIIITTKMISNRSGLINVLKKVFERIS